ncbi:LOW QUALITY PROTEIN: CWF19-like protein 2 [Cyprinus carpio]|uniref:LOW QUALITY PROTEIN: CWF19-like protein 2 n=1 Tax=Cyprinus carpio TaxID=7962 RepID=A0A9R0BA68_CYPCA|nr:LOW QUALITY PROTEIN: CWF19-like protein 2 [Cyprinus carpio]
MLRKHVHLFTLYSHFMFVFCTRENTVKNKKKKKEKKAKKSQKEKKKAKKEKKDEEDASCDSSERDEWMTFDFLAERRAQKEAEKEAERQKAQSIEEAGLHRLELNPYWKDGGSGLPPEDTSAGVVNDGGVSWLRKSYQRMKEQADREQCSLESMVVERYRSMEEFQKRLREAEEAAYGERSERIGDRERWRRDDREEGRERWRRGDREERWRDGSPHAERERERESPRDTSTSSLSSLKFFKPSEPDEDMSGGAGFRRAGPKASASNQSAGFQEKPVDDDDGGVVAAGGSAVLSESEEEEEEEVILTDEEMNKTGSQNSSRQNSWESSALEEKSKGSDGSGPSSSKKRPKKDQNKQVSAPTDSEKEVVLFRDRPIGDEPGQLKPCPNHRSLEEEGGSRKRPWKSSRRDCERQKRLRMERGVRGEGPGRDGGEMTEKKGGRDGEEETGRRGGETDSPHAERKKRDERESQRTHSTSSLSSLKFFKPSEPDEDMSGGAGFRRAGPKASASNQSAGFKKPVDDDDGGVVAAWRKCSAVQDPKEMPTPQKHTEKSAALLEDSKTTTKVSISESEEEEEEEVILTDEEMNKLGAKLVKAELMGSSALEEKLKAQMEAVRRAQRKDQNKQVSAPTDSEKEVVLFRTDPLGRAWPVKALSQPQEPRGGRRKQKAVYLCLPNSVSLTEGHCLIVPIQHHTAATGLDEDIWSEIQVQTLQTHALIYIYASICASDMNNA